jgi:hypothetical protein
LPFVILVPARSQGVRSLPFQLSQVLRYRLPVTPSLERQLGTGPVLGALPATLDTLAVDACDRFALVRGASDRATVLLPARLLALDGHEPLQHLDELGHVLKDTEHRRELSSVPVQVRGDVRTGLALAHHAEEDVKSVLVDQPLHGLGGVEELLVVEEAITTRQPAGAYILLFHLVLLFRTVIRWIRVISRESLSGPYNTLGIIFQYP